MTDDRDAQLLDDLARLYAQAALDALLAADLEAPDDSQEAEALEVVAN